MTLAEQYADFIAQFLPNGSSPTQDRQLKIAFYAGAVSALKEATASDKRQAILARVSEMSVEARAAALNGYVG